MIVLVIQYLSSYKTLAMGQWYSLQVLKIQQIRISLTILQFLSPGPKLKFGLA